MVSAAIFFHLPVYLFYLFVIAYDFAKLETGRDGYGGKLKFLTVWDMIFQTIYFGIAVANDFCGTSLKPSDAGYPSKKSSLQVLRDWLLASIVFPTGTFVVVTFWGIYAVDRELVFPKKLDALVPWWMNHAEHTLILPVLILEMMLIYHDFPSKKSSLTGLMTATVAYLSWILFLAFYKGFWVYPVLKVMNDTQRALFITGLMFFFVLLHWSGLIINRTLWGREVKIREKKKRK